MKVRFSTKQYLQMYGFVERVQKKIREIRKPENAMYSFDKNSIKHYTVLG